MRRPEATKSDVRFFLRRDQRSGRGFDFRRLWNGRWAFYLRVRSKPPWAEKKKQKPGNPAFAFSDSHSLRIRYESISRESFSFQQFFPKRSFILQQFIHAVFEYLVDHVFRIFRLIPGSFGFFAASFDHLVNPGSFFC